ncbi:hypothetical protein C7M84_025061 [Penaeus vannamei]|uniref:C2H2-type domain-containing protein n=1 Tax=Penaeus vannamei TaxID=6689 RepID=A0A3R7PCF0_PENVA|nr:hypothetical protein C7M84_025061 [Penaeus vannamei]
MSHLNSHVTIHSQEKPYQCSICSARFRRKDCLGRHLNTVHYNREYLQEPSPRDESGDVAEQSAFFQNFASFFTPSEDWKEALPLTVEINAGDFPVCLDTDNNSDAGEGVTETQDEEPDPPKDQREAAKLSVSQMGFYECEVCYQIFARECGLRTHMEVHSEIRPFACPHCKERFPHEASLIEHCRMHIDPAKNVMKPQKSPSDQEHPDTISAELRRFHKLAAETVASSEKLSRCAVIANKNIELSADNSKYVGPAEGVEGSQNEGTDLTGEVKNLLSQRRPYECQTCHASFKMKHHLKCHMVVHSDIKLFQCPQCSKAFSWNHTLKRHIKVHTKSPKKPRKSPSAQRPEKTIKQEEPRLAPDEEPDSTLPILTLQDAAADGFKICEDDLLMNKALEVKEEPNEDTGDSPINVKSAERDSLNGNVSRTT